tara:strand:- start:3284 stop:4186 length:903 start_codon:yes stop_codon:yes gene_type:complete
MSNIVSINTDNYSAMAKAMGMEQESSKSASTLPRLKLSSKSIMREETSSDGETQNVEKVPAGSFFLEFPEENEARYFGKGLTIRPFMQRFFLRKWVDNKDKKKGYFVKSLMADNLNVDLKDTDGTFNCGRPSGYIKDFKSLDAKMQEKIKAVDRVRSVFGTISFNKVFNVDGTDSDKEVKDVPFIWEITGGTAFKIVGETFKTLSTMKRLPVQHNMTLTTEAKPLNSGGSFFVPKLVPNYKEVLKVEEKEQEIFGNFIAWVEGFNGYISSSWDEKNRNNVSEEDMKVVDEFIEVDDNDEK